MPARSTPVVQEQPNAVPCSGRATPNLQKTKHALSLTQNPQWLAQASEKVEKTIEMINIKRVDDALQSLLDLDSVFESSGICINSAESESTQDTSIISPGQDNRTLRNKSAIQLAIITKYNLACCYQSKG